MMIEYLPYIIMLVFLVGFIIYREKARYADIRADRKMFVDFMDRLQSKDLGEYKAEIEKEVVVEDPLSEIEQSIVMSASSDMREDVEAEIRQRKKEGYNIMADTDVLETIPLSRDIGV